MRSWILGICLIFSLPSFAFKEIKGEFGYRFGQRPITKKFSLVKKDSRVGVDRFAHQYEFTPKKGKLPGDFFYRMFLSYRSRKIYKLQAYQIFPAKPPCQSTKKNIASFLAERYASKVEIFKVSSIKDMKFMIIPLGENNITLDCIVTKQTGSQIFNYKLVITYHNHASKKQADRERPKR